MFLSSSFFFTYTLYVYSNTGAGGLIFRADFYTEPVALKQISSQVMDASNLDEFSLELSMLARLSSHPGVVRSSVTLCLYQHSNTTDILEQRTGTIFRNHKTNSIDGSAERKEKIRRFHDSTCG